MTTTDVRRRVYRMRAAAEDRADGRTVVSGHAVMWDSRNSYAEQFVPGAFTDTLRQKGDGKPLVMGYQHREPIGRWTEYAEDGDGLALSGPISDTAQGRDAVTLLRDGVLTGLSIGFWPVRYQFAEPGERVTFQTPFGERTYEPDEPTIFVLEAELVEASLVMAPSDDDARVEAIREEREQLLTRARQERAAQALGNDASRRQTMSAIPSASTEAIDELRRSVSTLSEKVQEMNDGRADRETVERIAAEVVERQIAAARDEKARGHQPADVDPDATPALFRGRDRLTEIHQRSAGEVARLTRIPEADVRAFHDACDTAVLAAMILRRDVRELEFTETTLRPLARAINTQDAGAGVEFIPTELSASLIERVNLPLRVPALFPMIPMPTNPFKVPGMGVARVRGGIHPEQKGNTGQGNFKVAQPGTRQITLTAKKFAARILTSKEAEEDSIIAIMPFLQAEIVDYLSADLEDAVINGDTSQSHMDADVTDADDPRKAWDGLRARAASAAKTDAGNANASLAMLRENRKKMGKYGITPSTLAHITSMASYIDLLGDEAVQTVDKYGSGATVLTGELGRADGVPIIVSEYVRQDLDDDAGVYVGSEVADRTVLLTVHTGGYLRGSRRGMTVEWARELYIESDQDLVVASLRQAFEPRYPAATEFTVALHYNVATASGSA